MDGHHLRHRFPLDPRPTHRLMVSAILIDRWFAAEWFGCNFGVIHRISVSDNSI